MTRGGLARSWAEAIPRTCYWSWSYRRREGGAHCRWARPLCIFNLELAMVVGAAGELGVGEGVAGEGWEVGGAAADEVTVGRGGGARRWSFRF